MEVKVGDKFKVNNSKGEIVTVLYVPQKYNDLLLLRENGNTVRANGVSFLASDPLREAHDGPYIYWNFGHYADSDIFEIVYDKLGERIY